MQDYAIHASSQPFIKLVQSNVDLLTRFSTSPEVTAQAQRVFQQASESAMGLMQSGAFAQVVQGLLKNYTEFLIDSNQSTLSLLSQGQAAIVRQAQEYSENAVDIASARGRRSRQAA